jgi:hypothetical protein
MNDGKDATNPATAAQQAEPAASDPNTVCADPTIGTAVAGTRDGAACSAATAAEEEIDINHNFYAVDFRVHVSMRYHQARRAWWTGLNRISSIAAALAGSAAIITVFSSNSAPYWAYVAAASGAFAALNAALGFTERAREHATLYDKFSNIAARMAGEATPDDDVARRYRSEVLQLEASETPSIHTLNVVCHNQECEARGHGPEDLRTIYWYNRLFKSMFTVRDHFPLAMHSSKKSASTEDIIP